MKTIGFGALCAVLAFVVIITGQFLNLPLQNVLVGIAVGAVLGMVRIGSPLARFVGFLVGLFGGAMFYLLESLVFPSTWFGNAVAVALAIMFMAIVAAVTRGWLGLWSLFLGAVAFAATYDGFFATTPWLIQSQGPVLLGGMIFCVSCGFLSALFVEIGGPLQSPSQPSSTPTTPDPSATSAATDPAGSLTDIGFKAGQVS